MNYTVTRETFDSLITYWKDLKQDLDWRPIFILPVWSKVWWQTFQPDTRQYMVVVREQEKIIGIAPLQIQKGKAAFMGSDDVCDYLDFVVAPGKEKEFFEVLLDNLKGNGVTSAALGLVRQDSTTFARLAGIARGKGLSVSCQQESLSLEMELPKSWEDYLGNLGGKQRHELKRKLRRLDETGEPNFRTVSGEEVNGVVVETFFKLFKESREDKAAFLTDRMESFFRRIISAMNEVGLLRFGILELDARPVAMVMYFDYSDVIYLYNSGYDRESRSLSAGLLSKALLVKDSIEKGKKRFDFLKGNESYKYMLGGKEVPLYRCSLTIR